MLPMFTQMTDELNQEKTVLHGTDYRRGYKATELMTWIRQLGYVKSAGKASLTRLRETAQFTRSRAPQHHRCIETLLAIRAVEHVERGGQATQTQSDYLTQLYHRLGTEELHWCRHLWRNSADS